MSWTTFLRVSEAALCFTFMTSPRDDVTSSCTTLVRYVARAPYFGPSLPTMTTMICIPSWPHLRIAYYCEQWPEHLTDYCGS